MHYLLAVSAIWAFSFGLIGSALKGIDPFIVAACRLTIASLVLLPFLRPGKLSGANRSRLFLMGRCSLA